MCVQNVDGIVVRVVSKGGIKFWLELLERGKRGQQGRLEEIIFWSSSPC
jgi:hypothetical protein